MLVFVDEKKLVYGFMNIDGVRVVWVILLVFVV